MMTVYKVLCYFIYQTGYLYIYSLTSGIFILLSGYWCMYAENADETPHLSIVQRDDDDGS